MRLGFLLNQNTCIGCHACTVACKSEHQVPLGNFRTWVKYIEKGDFPDVKRSFAVLRCNHCDDAPCIAICPTKSLFRRKNGIVDFDSAACIGCKSCMQACPYDALYIDENTQTAAKCNFCAHRIEADMEPACVVVCPVQAIGVGDLDDPNSSISMLAKTGKATVRKPEQGTNSKTFYIGADADILNTAVDKDRGPYPFTFQDPTIPPAEPGAIRELYDVKHPQPWGWKVWSYLWTKSIAAGALLVAAILALVRGEWSDHPLITVAAPVIAMAFIAITAALLVFDLKRPERFWFLMVRPNFSSWLVWGGYILTAFGAIGGLWLIGVPLFWPAIPIAIATACYTAFLFWQAKGRDFWESKLLLPHLLAQCLVAGAASLAIVAPAIGARDVQPFLWFGLVVGLIGHFSIIAKELYGKHANRDIEKAANEILEGTHAKDFKTNVIVLGTAIPFALLALASRVGAIDSSLGLIASLLALWGLFRYERMWIIAGQTPPLS